MHPHYSLTPRLLLVGAGSLLALLVLVFLLGFELGAGSAPPAPAAAVVLPLSSRAAAAPAAPFVPTP